MKVNIKCVCGTMRIQYEDNAIGYIHTCAGCGKTYRGGFWIATWIQGCLPTSFRLWYSKRRMKRFLRQACRKALNEPA